MTDFMDSYRMDSDETKMIWDYCLTRGIIKMAHPTTVNVGWVNIHRQTFDFGCYFMNREGLREHEMLMGQAHGHYGEILDAFPELKSKVVLQLMEHKDED